jgi:hypothetical protein
LPSAGGAQAEDFSATGTSVKVLGLDWPRARHSAWHYGLLRERRKATAQRFRRSQGGIAPLR